LDITEYEQKALVSMRAGALGHGHVGHCTQDFNFLEKNLLVRDAIQGHSNIRGMLVPLKVTMHIENGKFPETISCCLTE
jgi:hypothetical protein